MYFFQFKEKKYCIDATIETSRYGRLINHSRQNANLKTKVISYHGLPHLIFIAKIDIEIGTELLYDYGDRSKTNIAANPWLAA